MTATADKHTYAAVYNGRTAEIKAESLYGAKLAAVEHFKAPRSKQSQIGVYLIETADGNEVQIAPE